MSWRRSELIEEIRREIELTREEIAHSRASYEAQLQITREMVRRNELAFEDSRRALADLSGQVRVQTAAILKLLDSGGQDPAPAG